MKVQLNIEGMACHHCSGKIRKFLESNPELSDIQVDLEGKKAEFTCREGLDMGSIAKGITDLGYKTTLQ